MTDHHKRNRKRVDVKHPVGNCTVVERISDGFVGTIKSSSDGGDSNKKYKEGNSAFR